MPARDTDAAEADSEDESRHALRVDVVRESDAWHSVPGIEVLAARAARAAHAAERPEAAEVSVVLADDALQQRLNRDFRGKDRPTNVLSFPAAPSPPGELRHLGDIVLAYETVAAEAAGDGKALADHAAHLVVHGMLHLLGHDHEDPAEAERMEQAEIGILARLGIADPYAGAPLTRTEEP